MEKIFLSNPIKAYLIVAGIIVLTLVVKRVIAKYLANLLYKLVAKASKNIEKQSFFDLVIQPLDTFLVLLISFIALDKLKFPEICNFTIFKFSLQTIVDRIANGVMVVVFIWLCLRLIDFMAMILEDKANATKDQTDNQLVVFFKDFFKVILVLIGVLMVLHFSFHKNIGNLLTGLSIVGAAIALATRESLENLIASFIIFFDKPFVTGDLVKVHSFTGTVEKIGLRSTRIRTDSKTFITVPNKQMVDSILDNVTLRTQRKVEIHLELGLDSTVAKMKQLIATTKELLTKEESVESFHVYFSDTGKNAHVVLIEYFTQMPQEQNEFLAVKESINFGIIMCIEQLGLELAAANTDVKVHNV